MNFRQSNIRRILKISVCVLCCCIIIGGLILGNRIILIQKNIYEIIVFDGTKTTWTDPDIVYAYYMVCRPNRSEDGLTKQLQEFLKDSDIVEEIKNEYPDREIQLLFFQPSNFFDIGFFPEDPSEFTVWTGMTIASVKYIPDGIDSIEINIDIENLLDPLQ